jgi:uncharacterized protein YecE (DUF72 family)
MASVHNARWAAGSHVAGAALRSLRIGTAGWALPKAQRTSPLGSQSVLEHYAALFDAVEINSSFYRPHRRATYERWRESVPESFRFSVKLPRMITHELDLADCQGETISFMQSVGGLEQKLAVLLVQLPPGGIFDESVASAFFDVLRQETSAHLVCEARNPSWFANEATSLFEAYGITRVVADPVPTGCEFAAQTTARFAYFRLHGSPRMYYSPYSIDYLKGVAAVAGAAAETWCIFDNTAAGAAWSDAATLQRLIKATAGSTG